eukprot:scaffold830_cov377-Prasinococcus_capsulatus_cf.AAC.11
MLWNTERSREYSVEYVSNIIVVCFSKRGLAYQQLIDEDSEGPDIHRPGVALPCDDLWGLVIGRSTYRESVTTR